MMIEQAETKAKSTAPVPEKQQTEHTEQETAERMLRADVPEDGFYKDRIRELSKSNTQLREEKEKLEKELQEKEVICAEQQGRISKLEKALIEATIK